MNITFITDGLFANDIGGIQKHSTMLLNALLELGVDITLLHPYSSIPIELNQKTDGNLNSVQIRYPKIRFPGGYILSQIIYSLRCRRQLKSSVDKNKIIYAQGFTAMALRNTTKCKIVSNLHGLEMFQDSGSSSVANRTMTFLAHRTLKASDYSIALGEKLERILIAQNLRREQVLTIPNGIGKDWINRNKIRVPESKLRFVFIGRDEPRKNFKLLLEVMNSLSTNNFKLTVIGNFQITEKSTFDLNYLGVIHSEQVIKDVLRETDVLINCSSSEGMPTVVLEGMACGNAIICTDTGASSELIDGNGWLVNLDDLKINLKRVINLAIQTNPKEIEHMKVKSLKLIESKYTWDKIATQTINQLSKIGWD